MTSGHETSSGQGKRKKDEFRLGALLGYRLSRLSNAIGSLAETEAGEIAGLSLPEYRVVVVLHSRGPSGVAALQREMMIDKAWVSRTLASLAAKGFVASEADPTDARRTVFKTTPIGERAGQALVERALKRQERLLRGIAAGDRERLLSYLDRIEANVESLGR